MREAGAEVVLAGQVFIAMDGYKKPTWTYLRRLLEQIPGVKDVFKITLNSYYFLYTLLAGRKA